MHDLETHMTAFNVVRFRVKPGREQEFLDAHRDADTSFAGYRGGVMIKTGERTYCLIGGWDDFDSIVAARPGMIGMLDRVRDLLEDQGGGLGVTDPVSGETVVELPLRKRAPARRRRRPASRAGGGGEDEPGEPAEET
jgi:hypothetical protein